MMAVYSASSTQMTEIRIAGASEGGRLLFSVKDNGCGFDPSRAPGMEQGHFGLQGISDRVESLDGTFTIESAAGEGTTAKVELPLAADERDGT